MGGGVLKGSMQKIVFIQLRLGVEIFSVLAMFVQMIFIRNKLSGVMVSPMYTRLITLVLSVNGDIHVKVLSK